MPISISEDWNLISRTEALRLSARADFCPVMKTSFGFGNVAESFYCKTSEKGGLIRGVGPVLSIPTATDGIAPNQWGAGITGVALTQKDGWTYGDPRQPDLVDKRRGPVADPAGPASCSPSCR